MVPSLFRLAPLALLALPLLLLLARGAPLLPSTLRDLDVVGASLVLAALGALFALLAGLGLASAAWLGRMSSLWEGALLLGYLVPPFVTGMGLLFSFQTFGVGIKGVPGILLAWTLHYTPLAYLLMKPQAKVALGLLTAARVHGVTGLRALRVFLPPLLPPLAVAGGTLYLALLGNFGVPSVLGTPAGVYVLPTLAYARLLSPFGTDPLGQAAALGIWLALLALSALVLARPATLEPREFLLPPARSLYRLAYILYALLALVLTLMGLLREAMQNPYTGALQPAFAQALSLPLVRAGLGNSFLLALLATLILLSLGLALRPFPTALRRTRSLLDLYYLLPGTLLGLGLILLLAPTPLYGTPWILLLAYLLNFAALALRALESGPRVEGAVAVGRVHGLSPWRAWWRLGYPLLWPSAFAGAFLIFPLAFAEITLSALLYAPGAETIGVAVLSALSGGLYREAAALGLVLMGFSALGLLGRPRW